MTSKDVFIGGSVIGHNHSLFNYTSIDKGHVHLCLAVTFPPTPSNGGHVHYIEGYVLFENGHVHYFKTWSSPAIVVGDGMHVHYYDFYTTVENGHKHHIFGVDNPTPGTI